MNDGKIVYNFNCPNTHCTNSANADNNLASKINICKSVFGYLDLCFNHDYWEDWMFFIWKTLGQEIKVNPTSHFIIFGAGFCFGILVCFVIYGQLSDNFMSDHESLVLLKGGFVIHGSNFKVLPETIKYSEKKFIKHTSEGIEQANSGVFIFKKFSRLYTIR